MKITNRTRTLVTASLALAAAFALGYATRRARAAGIPQSSPLTYSGVLTDANGLPMSGQPNIVVQLYPTLTGGSALCGSAPTTTLSGGAFQAPLEASCTDFIHSNPDLYVDVLVGGASVGRTKLGAVPYTLEAQHAVSADSAAAADKPSTGGGIATAIAALQSSVASLQQKALTVVETGLVASEVANVPAPNCDVLRNVSAPTRTCVLNVTFQKQFSEPPTVTAGLASFDESTTDSDTRILVNVTAVTAKGFSVTVGSWSSATFINSMTVQWMAVGR